jgi:hypothetical protein
MRWAIASVSAAAVVVATGCGHGKLVPAVSSTVVPGAPGAAFLIVDGVRCSADAAAWEGPSGALPDFVTPVKVRIVNSSGSAIRLLYEDFALVGRNGAKYRPVPVLPIDPDANMPRIEPMYASTRFFVSARFHDAYQTLDAWPEPLGRDEGLYEEEYRHWGAKHPPFEAVRMSLPEGVLADGGVVSGFLYFETPRHEDKVTFEAELDAINGRDTIAEVRIPFQIQ